MSTAASPVARASAELRRTSYDIVDRADDGSTRQGFDAVSALSVYLFLLLLIPSDRAVPGLGNLGAPAILWGFGCFLWWVWHVLSRRRSEVRVFTPVGVAAWAFFAAILLSYIFGMMRAIPVEEISPADRNLFRMLSFLGVALVAANGIRTFGRLVALLRRFSVLAALVALLGILEFVTETPLAASIPTPWLVGDGTGGAGMRGDFLRPAATASHPLEYAMTLAVAFPVALMLALRSRGRTRAVMLVSVGFIAMALIIAGSRSAILGLVIGVVPLLFTLGARERLKAFIAGGAALVVVYVAVPGMIGTLRHLFQSAGSDTSVLSRTASLDVFSVLLPISPWTGRGLGTLLPQYRIFDNQYLLLLLELGVVGTVAFLALYVVAILSVVRCRTAPPAISGLAVALAASCLVAVALSAFFDSFSFPKAFGLLALMPGLCGGAWSISERLPAAFADHRIEETRDVRT
ncbi:O-antigen ligase family protein [Microbacterium oryzae]|uniref:O-antigen ligase family protein n=1 Tax=Microbacterium oryzae TaxID=743009 RepID=UPI0025B1BDC0|nr:O-antigen ligase family protein [Microbacterium oryzae]MDN3310114.1 O-antigen ligase family protein [Microbacterium oryzae]